MTSKTQELVVVTGTSSGIGRATVERLAAAGYHVLAGVRRQEDADKVSADNVEAVIVDITKQDTLRALARRVAGDPRGRPLRAVVNNAGIAVNAPLEVVPLDELRRQIEVGVVGQLAVVQALMPALLADKGRVINIGSLGGKVSMPGFGVYSAAKFAMEAVNDSLRREMAHSGIKVVMITPGAVSTGMSEQGIASVDRLARLMTPEQHQRHDRVLDAVKRLAKQWARSGIRPEKVASVILSAIRDANPRTRYAVGPDSALMTRMIRFAPDRLLDLMLNTQMRLN